MNVLVSGFEAFANQRINPTQKIVEALPHTIDGHRIKAIVVPTVQYKCIEVLEKEIETFKPDVVLMLGQAGGIAEFHIERVALNIDDFRIADNEANQPIDTPIYHDGPSAFFSTLPIKKITKNLNEAGYHAIISNSAGTYVCNHLFYGCGYLIHKTNRNIRFGFIHVPFETSQASNDQPSLPLQTMIDAIMLAIKTIINTQEDILLSGGLEF